MSASERMEPLDGGRVAERSEALGGRVTITAAELAEALGWSAKDAGGAPHLLAVGTALVERYAPCAPEALQNEAVIRVAGWLADMPEASVAEWSLGEMRQSYAVGQISALRHSGAMALLSPWKVRRGGVV